MTIGITIAFVVGVQIVAEVVGTNLYFLKVIYSTNSDIVNEE